MTEGDPDRKATGFSVGQLPESSAITPGGRDTYKTAQGYGIRVGIQTARQQVSASGASHSQPITLRRREYARRETSNTSRAVQTYTAASGDFIRNGPDELV